MKRYSKKKKKYTDNAVYQVSIVVPISYIASERSLFAKTPVKGRDKKIAEHGNKIEEIIKSAGYDDYKVVFDGFELPF